MTLGDGYTAASGTIYPTGLTAEPSSFALFGTALWALFICYKGLRSKLDSDIIPTTERIWPDQVSSRGKNAS